jgi:hypothetical protein
MPVASHTRANASAAPGGAISAGRAGIEVPGQPLTGTGCWRGA